jgi:hypothetical protein
MAGMALGETVNALRVEQMSVQGELAKLGNVISAWRAYPLQILSHRMGMDINACYLLPHTMKLRTLRNCGRQKSEKSNRGKHGVRPFGIGRRLFTSD